MADPFSMFVAACGILSTLIQVSQSLTNFYADYKNQDDTIMTTFDGFQTLNAILCKLREVLNERKSSEIECAFVETIANSISRCEKSIDILQEEYQKCQKLSPDDTKGLFKRIKNAQDRLSYPFEVKTLERLETKVKDILGNLSIALKVLELADGAQLRMEIRAANDLARADQISQNVRDWLKAPDATTDFIDASEKRVPQSGLWLVRGPAFTSYWLNTDKSFLWVHGLSGCGKSILSTTAIQYVRRHCQSNPSIGYAYFYFISDDDRKQNVSAMVRAVLLQLSTQLKNGNSIFAHFYRHRGHESPSLPLLLEILREMISDFQDVYIIIDGLDMSHGSARDEVLETLDQVRQWPFKGLHMLVTSRDELDIRESLQPSPEQEISVTNADVEKDITAYISQKLKKKKKLLMHSGDHALIRDKLVARADGSFELARCQLDSLAECFLSIDDLMEALELMPASIEEAYARKLRSINKNQRGLIKRLLTVLYAAKRQMTPSEINHALGVGLGDNPRLYAGRRLPDERCINSICPGLVSVTSTLPKRVRFEHHCVREYLESDHIRQQNLEDYSMQRAASHSELAYVCLVYLQDPHLSHEQLNATTLKSMPLAEYAARYWYDHYSEAGEVLKSASPLAHCARNLFENRSGTFQNCIRLWDPDTRSGRRFQRTSESIAPPIYYASFLGLHQTLHQLLLDQDIDVNASGGEYGSALRAASARGHYHVIEILLNKHAEINARDEYHGNALHLASAKGHEHIVKLLLENNADASAEGGIWGNAFQAASDAGHETICDLLLTKIKEVSPQDLIYSDVLQTALDDECDQHIDLLFLQNAIDDIKNGYHNDVASRLHVGRTQTSELDFGKTVQTASSGHGSHFSRRPPPPPYVLIDALESY